MPKGEQKMKLIEKYKSAKRKIHIRRNKMKMRNIPKLKGVDIYNINMQIVIILKKVLERIQKKP